MLFEHFAQIVARRENWPFRGENDYLNRAVYFQPMQTLQKFQSQINRERIAAFRAIQSNGGDPVFDVRIQT